MYEAVTENRATIMKRFAEEFYTQVERKDEERELRPLLKDLFRIDKTFKYENKDNFNIYLGEIISNPEEEVDLVVRNIADSFQTSLLKRVGAKREEKLKVAVEKNCPYADDNIDLENLLKETIPRGKPNKYRFALLNLFIRSSSERIEINPQLALTNYMMTIFGQVSYIVDNCIGLEIIHYHDTDYTIYRMRGNYKHLKYGVEKLQNFLDVTHGLNSMILKGDLKPNSVE